MDKKIFIVAGLLAIAQVSVVSSVAQAADQREKAEIQFYDAMLGKTYSIAPKSTAIMRVDFYDYYGKDFDLKNATVWHPETVSSFQILQRIPLTPSIAHHRYDAFKVQFADGRIQYVQVRHFGTCDDSGCRPAPSQNSTLAKYIEGIEPES